jgi:hypothetical protein
MGVGVYQCCLSMQILIYPHTYIIYYCKNVGVGVYLVHVKKTFCVSFENGGRILLRISCNSRIYKRNTRFKKYNLRLLQWCISSIHFRKYLDALDGLFCSPWAHDRLLEDTTLLDYLWNHHSVLQTLYDNDLEHPNAHASDTRSSRIYRPRYLLREE